MLLFIFRKRSNGMVVLKMEHKLLTFEPSNCFDNIYFTTNGSIKGLHGECSLEDTRKVITNTKHNINLFVSSLQVISFHKDMSQGAKYWVQVTGNSFFVLFHPTDN